MATKIRNFTILGSGMMGKGVAQLLAGKGFPVTIYTRDIRNSDAVMETIKLNINLLVDNDILRKEDVTDILNRIKITDSFEAAAESADMIIENIVENLEIKQEYFTKLDSICDPKVILASNTSAISITEIGAGAKHKERIIGTHFWNPAFLIPLVEVIKTGFVSEEVVEQTCDVMAAAGKKPIIVKRDVPGFLANRMQHALVREAWAIVQNGIADPKDVDDAIKYSFGMRLPFMGCMEQGDAVGLDLGYSIQSYLFKYLDNSTEPVPILKEKVLKNELGFKTNGVGMQNWSPEAQDKYNRDLVTNLINVAKVLNRI
jgi:3-hydroxybutyryl-CoA dehydrogenase